MTVRALLRNPSAYAPVAMSVAAIFVLAVALVSGTARQSDEGAAAHLFQLLIALQLPFVAFFLLRWLRRAPQEAGKVFLLQVTCAVAALAPVYFLGL
jgi:hypothetical protein